MAIENYLTAAEAAELIGCTGNRVRQLIRAGAIQAKKIGHGMWLVPVNEAEKARDLPYKTGRPRNSKKFA